ncbi:LPP20 family lipoprotein [Arcobacteraceae bacterium]|nr:LPP20 family lipoprotein [Arcobacteraceae bacterium]
MKRLALLLFHSKKLLIAIFIIASFSACVSNLTSLKQDENIPTWYINAPLNNAVYIYGEGQSINLSDAKDNALNAMASKLIVSVGSSTSSVTTTSLNNNVSSYSKDVIKDVKIDVQKIKFTNASVEKSTKIADEYYILMKVNRVELFDNKKKEFDINDNRITSEYNTLDKYGKLEQIHILQNIYPSIIKAKKESIILNVINNDFNNALYIEKYDSYIDKIAQLKNDSTIMVSTNNKEKYFADILIDLLNQNQYKVSNSSNADLKVSLNNKVKYSIARAWNIAKVTSTISVSSNNKIISNMIINSLGRSSTSKESALENASQNFLMQIQEKTLDKVIFNK